jgi:hypothetical protein
MILKPYVDDVDFQLHIGDVRDVLATLPDESIVPNMRREVVPHEERAVRERSWLRRDRRFRFRRSV